MLLSLPLLLTVKYNQIIFVQTNEQIFSNSKQGNYVIQIRTDSNILFIYKIVFKYLW